ncbi:transglutaminase-like cysteine peptidase [Psychrosphaera haliotis]|uniref:Sulfate adenylyltransferase n=1 Tax=Psychrosphaera haliotis TaxID=555083 RepID=A0A6N8F428_9GAMM|nr:transglutaminase-like cysteine peptidase [Psychrosphaera haliotis]MUH71426.1 hypothetical protein [Psychrosphaera haliotis]
MLNRLKSAAAVFLVLFSLITLSSPKLDMDKLVAFTREKYDEDAVKRIIAWRAMIDNKQQLPEQEKLKLVNQFFNYFEFVDDIRLWGKEDYWATPLEFIGIRGGDCEDFAVAKYFTLLELGIPMEKLRLGYVKSLTLNQFHMVLAYYPTKTSMPLILDNIDGEIKPAYKRKDLVLIVSFNGQKLWLNKQKGKGKTASSSARMADWDNLSNRYSMEQFMSEE